MYVEITSKPIVPPGRATFAIHDLTELELELLQSGLIEVKQRSLQDAEAFRNERTACNEMFQKIDQELRNSRS
jgi:hypothetical protein